MVLCLSVLVFFASATAQAWTGHGHQPTQNIDAVNKGARFSGAKDKPDQFRVFSVDQGTDTIFLGSINAVYNLSISSFEAQATIEWSPDDKNRQMCRMKGKSEAECNNYIRVLHYDHKSQKAFVCGTNAFRPLCRVYGLMGHTTKVMETFPGFGITPYDPNQYSTATFLPETEQVFSGTVSDFAGTDPLIYRKNIGSSDYGVRTARQDPKCLNEPRFVSSNADLDYVYFWFHEGVHGSHKCDSGLVSRVARVCRSDLGGPRNHEDEWTTFLKARLNCSIPGPFPYYFDRLEATSNPVPNIRGSSTIYAVFTTPYSTFKSSAVCAFSMQDVRSIFEQGNIHVQASPLVQWGNVLRDEGQQLRRPGSCSKNSRTLSDSEVTFMKNNPLMDGAVPNYFSQPVFHEVDDSSLPTAIAVDQVKDIAGTKYDVVFLGTSDGKIKKIINQGPQADPIFVESVDVFPGRKIESLVISASRSARVLIVISSESVAKIPLHHCDAQSTCGGCVRLRDPYCAWDVDANRCMSSITWNDGNYAQDVQSGRSTKCFHDEYRFSDAAQPAPAKPDRPVKPEIPKFDDDKDAESRNCKCNSTTTSEQKHPTPEYHHAYRTTAENSLNENEIDLSANSDQYAPVTQAKKSSVEVESLVIAIFITAAAALLIGFAIGYRCQSLPCLALARKKAKSSTSPSPQVNVKTWMTTANSLKPPTLNDLSHPAHMTSPIDAYNAPPKFNGEPLNLDLCLDDRSLYMEKNLDSLEDSLNLSNTSTLPKDYKYRVRKMYL